MKLQLLSDLHLDFKPYALRIHPEAGMLILAGDLAELHRIGRIRRLVEESSVPVIAVLGNHDHYGAELTDAIDDWKDLAKRLPVGQFTVLDDEHIEFDKFVMVGGTLWTDFSLYGTPTESGRLAQRGVADFNLIRMNGTPLLPQDLIARHRRTRQAISTAVAIGKPTMVITHFCPFPQSVHPRYAGDSLNPYFASDCSDLLRPNVKLWLHGHTHSAFDYRLGDTRVVCNPRGYPGESSQYDHQLLVEI